MIHSRITVLSDHTEKWLRVILVMREDYTAQLDPYADLLPGRLRARFRLERLRRDPALAAVVNPLPPGYAFADGVAEQLVEDLLTIHIQRASGSMRGPRRRQTSRPFGISSARSIFIIASLRLCVFAFQFGAGGGRAGSASLR